MSISIHTTLPGRVCPRQIHLNGPERYQMTESTAWSFPDAIHNHFVSAPRKQPPKTDMALPQTPFPQPLEHPDRGDPPLSLDHVPAKRRGCEPVGRGHQAWRQRWSSVRGAMFPRAHSDQGRVGVLRDHLVKLLPMLPIVIERTTTLMVCWWSGIEAPRGSLESDVSNPQSRRSQISRIMVSPSHQVQWWSGEKIPGSHNNSLITGCSHTSTPKKPNYLHGSYIKKQLWHNLFQILNLSFVSRSSHLILLHYTTRADRRTKN